MLEPKFSVISEADTKDRFFTEVIKLKCGHECEPESSLTYVLMKRGNLDTVTFIDNVKRTKVKTAIYKPRRETWRNIFSLQP